MEKLIENPFRFGNPVRGDYYYPRPELTSAVRNFLISGIHVVLMGPRRFGKTSFVNDLFRILRSEGYTCITVDVFNVTSLRDFLIQLLRTIRSEQSLFKRLKNWWTRIGKPSPKLQLDVDAISGTHSLGISLGRIPESDLKNAIQDVLEGLSSLGEKVVVGLDEFQQISQIDDSGWLEATLRTHLQKLDNVSFLFTGSRKSLIAEMMNDPSRPLYRSAQVIEFPHFGPDFSDWVTQRFEIVGVSCSRAAVDHLRQLVQDTPNYVQMVCFHLVAQAKTRVSKKDVEQALAMVARQNAYAYQTILASLTPAQQRALRLAANESESVFQKANLEKYEISTTPALHSSIKTLKSKGILGEEGTSKGRVRFDDPLFAYWLKMTFPI